MSLEIHWHEGLFLQPHHLQRMQRSIHDRLSFERKLGCAYPYGIIEARLSRDQLANMSIGFDRLRAIMPSGQIVSFPEHAELPSLDIKAALSRSVAGFKIFLGVPLWQNTRANAISTHGDGDTRVKLLYRVGELECTDENSGENPKPLQVRKTNSRLMFEHEDPSDMELLPLMRVLRATGEDDLPRQDPDYVPPCFVLAGSSILRELVRDLVNKVEAHRKSLVVQITRGGFSLDAMRGPQLEQLMRLTTLNRFSGSLPALLETPNVTPFDFYLQFRELLGELAALRPDRDLFETAPYDHDNPLPVFKEISDAVRDLLQETIAPAFIKVPFAEANGRITANLAAEHFTQPNGYLLGIKTPIEATVLGKFVEDADKFKLMSQSMAERAIRGVALKEDRNPPVGLPAYPDLHYFRLDRTASPTSEQMWQRIQTEKIAAIRWTGSQLDFAGTSFTLYMTIPSSAK
jgi:type VI secretion system ImpJ/VasE family protein